MHCNQESSSFDEIKHHIKKSSSTTSWNLKKLLDENIISKSIIKKKNYSYALRDPRLIDRITRNPNNLCIDRVFARYISLVEYSSTDKREII